MGARKRTAIEGEVDLLREGVLDRAKTILFRLRLEHGSNVFLRPGREAGEHDELQDVFV